MGWVRLLLNDVRFRLWCATVLPTTLVFLVAALVLRAVVRSKLAGSLAPGGLPPEHVFDSTFPGHYILVGMLLAVAVSSAVGLFLIERGLMVVQRVNRLARELAAGNFQVRTQVRPHESTIVQELGGNINALAESLERTDRLRRELVANLAHEIRTPLTNLQGYIEALRDGVIAANPEALDTVHEEVMRLVRLVDALHQLARADALRHRPLELVPTDLDSLAEQLMLVMQPHAANRSIRLTHDLHAQGRMVPVHADSVAQVMRNLLRNAVQYTEDGGTIRVQTHVGAGLFTFVCLNTGPGIPSDDLPHIFQRFFRSERSRGTTGVGLGLAIAKELVEAHGGRIGAESKNGWTSIWFELPTEPGRRLATV